MGIYIRNCKGSGCSSKINLNTSTKVINANLEFGKTLCTDCQQWIKDQAIKP